MIVLVFLQVVVQQLNFIERNLSPVALNDHASSKWKSQYTKVANCCGIYLHEFSIIVAYWLQVGILSVIQSTIIVPL